MTPFEQGFVDELVKIADYAGYTDEEMKNLRRIMRKDVKASKKARKGLIYGGPVGLLAGAGMGALAGARKGGGRRGALEGAALGSLLGAGIGPFVGSVGATAPHAPELWKLYLEGHKIHEGKTKEQRQKMLKALWKGVPKR